MRFFPPSPAALGHETLHASTMTRSMINPYPNLPAGLSQGVSYTWFLTFFFCGPVNVSTWPTIWRKSGAILTKYQYHRTINSTIATSPTIQTTTLPTIPYFDVQGTYTIQVLFFSKVIGHSRHWNAILGARRGNRQNSSHPPNHQLCNLPNLSDLHC